LADDRAVHEGNWIERRLNAGSEVIFERDPTFEPSGQVLVLGAKHYDRLVGRDQADGAAGRYPVLDDSGAGGHGLPAIAVTPFGEDEDATVLCVDGARVDILVIEQTANLIDRVRWAAADLW
jgi:hypothetical protein